MIQHCFRRADWSAKCGWKSKNEFTTETQRTQRRILNRRKQRKQSTDQCHLCYLCYLLFKNSVISVSPW